MSDSLEYTVKHRMPGGKAIRLAKFLNRVDAVNYAHACSVGRDKGARLTVIHGGRVMFAFKDGVSVS